MSEYERFQTEIEALKDGMRYLGEEDFVRLEDTSMVETKLEGVRK